MAYTQVPGASNEAFRDAWVASSLTRVRGRHEAPTLLDVGAGSSPYRPKALELGFRYRSHDFSAYVPQESSPGIQSVTWDYADLMSQEVSRLLAFKPHIKGLSRVGGNLARKLRGRLPNDVLQSGAFGTLFVGSRPS